MFGKQGVLFAFGFITGLNALGAPHPGTLGSVTFDKSLGLSFVTEGFVLPTQGLGWTLVDKDRFELPQNGDPSQANPSHESAQLTIHTETLKKKQDLAQYSKQWIKEYSQYGFELLGTKSLGGNESPALLVDLYHRKSDKQLRQVIRLRDLKVAILTCSHSRQGFSSVLGQCNQIMERFNWVN